MNRSESCPSVESEVAQWQSAVIAVVCQIIFAVRIYRAAIAVLVELILGRDEPFAFDVGGEGECVLSACLASEFIC